MLILDEPTNHLDIDSRDALVARCNDYTGAVLIISHDRHLIDATADKLWIAQNGTIEEFDDDLDSYQRQLTSNANGKVAKKDGCSHRGRRPQGGAAGGGGQAASRSRRCASRSRMSSRSWGGCAPSWRGSRGSSLIPRPMMARPSAVMAAGQGQGPLRGEIATAEERWLTLSEELELAEKA